MRLRYLSWATNAFYDPRHALAGMVNGSMSVNK
jgi:hypothetical protein